MGTRGGGWKEDDGRRSLVSSIYLTVQESFKWPRNEAREGGTCVGLQGRGRKKGLVYAYFHQILGGPHGQC